MAACVQCGTALPRGATACPSCGTPVARPARKPAANKPAAKAVAKPAVKAAAVPAKPAARSAKPLKATAAAATKPAKRTARATAPVAAEAPEAPEAPETPPVEAVETPPETSVETLDTHGANDPWETGPAALGRRGEDGPGGPGGPGGPDGASLASRPAAFQRLVGGDWSRPARAALVALAVTLVLAALATASAQLAAGVDGGGDPVFSDLTAGRWLKYVCAAVGLSFGSSMSVEPTGGGGFFFVPSFAVAIAPLTVTIGALWALYARARKELGDTADRVGEVARMAAVFALGIGVLTAFGRWTLTEDDAGVRFVTSPWKPMFWAFAAAVALAWLATGTRTVPDRWRDLALSSRAAAAGVATGVGLGFVLMVALAYQPPDQVETNAGDVTRTVPLMASFGVNLGNGILGSVSGGRLHVLTDTDKGWWPLVSSDLPAYFYLGLLIPFVAVGVAVLYLRRRSDAAALPRLCALMAAPAALLFLTLAVAGTARASVGIGLGFSAGARAGASTWSALLVALWFGLGGWLAAKALARRV
jgi:uncharacterized Zn finger protein (UPF0148 family)